MMELEFAKMQGLGNDFVVVDARRAAIPLDEHQIRFLADRRLGVGCDQVIRLEPSDRSDVFMRIWNPDGREAQACGNATRCIAHTVMQESGRDCVSVETVVGVLPCHAEAGGNIAVSMGEPRFGWRDIPLSSDVQTRSVNLGPQSPGRAFCLSMGNPHAVIPVSDVDQIDVQAIGPLLELHPLFPERANISFAEVLSHDHIRAHVWERGAGQTSACGSAACAIAVACAELNLAARSVRVTMPGGDLSIAWDADNSVWMSGPVALVFRGTVSVNGYFRDV